MNQRWPKKLFLDEMIPRENRHDFPADFVPLTALNQDWRVVSGGRLLQLAAEAGFDALITMDKTMKHHARTPPFPVLVIRGCPQEAPEVVKRIPDIVRLLETAPANGYHDVWMR